MELAGEEITDVQLEKFYNFEKSLAEKMMTNDGTRQPAENCFYYLPAVW